MTSNRTEDASTDSERCKLIVCIVDHNFILTTNWLWLDVQQGMRVDVFLTAALAKYPGVFGKAFAEIYYIPGGLFPTSSKKFDTEDWVVVNRMQTFTRHAEALQADPELWTKIPNDVRRVYYVIQTPAPTPVKAIGGDDEDYESTGTVEKRLPLLYEQTAPELTSSILEKSSPAALNKAGLHRFVNYGCPRDTESIPLIPLSSVFGQFKDDCNRQPDSEMCRAMNTYAKAAIAIAEELSEPVDDKLLMVRLNGRLEDLYRIRLFALLRFPTAMDGRLFKNGRLQLLTVVKTRNPGCDPLVQGAANYRRFYTECLEELDSLPEGGVLPAFLITCQGPLINVYGIACVEKGQVQTEYLTSVNAGCHWKTEEEMYKLTRILYALRKALDRLDELPALSGAPASPPRERQKATRTRPEQTVWPYPRTFTHLGSGTDVEFRYLKLLDGEGYLFEAQLVDKPSELVLVKLTQSYGRAVHEDLARAGYAPQLLGFSELPGGWKMVVMELLEYPVWVDGTLLPEDCRAIRQGLATVRNEILPLLQEKGHVHGDIRLDNLLFRIDRVADDSGPAVKLIDFDYSGEAGKATYPWNLNTEIRPQCQLPCAPLEFLHDKASLEMMEDEVGISENVSD